MHVRNLTGTVLDAWVASALGYEVHIDDLFNGAVAHGIWITMGDARLHIDAFRPSKDWTVGGPLIERYNISCIRMEDRYGTDESGFCNDERIPVWAAMLGQNPDVEVILEDEFYGATPLEAAMRCLVAHKQKVGIAAGLGCDET